MPARESHHVVASLQLANGGRRRLFVRQEMLATLREAARPPLDRHVVGFLHGSLFECPATGVSYLVVDVLGPPAELGTETPIAALRSALSSLAPGPKAGVMGWFYIAPVSGAMPRGFGEDLAAEAARHLQPWQTTLVVASADRGTDGAFLLWDAVESRAFRSPFYELLDERTVKPNAPKNTQMAWPSYSTGDLVVPATAPVQSRRNVEQPHAPPGETESPSRWTFWRKRGGDRTVNPRGRTKASPAAGHREPATPATRVAKPQAETSAPREQHPRRRQSAPNVELGDTAEGDSIERYGAVARKDGFYVAAKFNAETSPEQRETLWVLQDPYAGLLLTVVANDIRVLEASLHYNIHVNDTEVLKSTFSGYRNDEAQVIYVRESSIDQLRARTERARASGKLQRDWKVTPTIYFVTPSEWDAAAASGDAARPAQAIDALNRRRIAAIPDSITSRFGLRPTAEDQ